MLAFLMLHRIPAEQREDAGFQRMLHGYTTLAEKDLAVTLAFAREHGVELPGTALCQQLMARVYGLDDATDGEHEETFDVGSDKRRQGHRQVRRGHAASRRPTSRATSSSTPPSSTSSARCGRVRASAVRERRLITLTVLMCLGNEMTAPPSPRGRA